MPARKQTAPYIAVRLDRDDLLDVAVALRDDSLGAAVHQHQDTHERRNTH